MLDLRFKGDNGHEFEAHVNSRDILKWERTTKGVSFIQMEDSLRMEHLYKLGWIAAVRAGDLQGVSLADFEAGYDVLLDKNEDDELAGVEVDPTQTEA